MQYELPNVKHVPAIVKARSLVIVVAISASQEGRSDINSAAKNG
jgi:hypothetical protein